MTIFIKFTCSNVVFLCLMCCCFRFPVLFDLMVFLSLSVLVAILFILLFLSRLHDLNTHNSALKWHKLFDFLCLQFIFCHHFKYNIYQGCWTYFVHVFLHISLLLKYFALIHARRQRGREERLYWLSRNLHTGVAGLSRGQSVCKAGRLLPSVSKTVTTVWVVGQFRKQ